MAGSLIRDIDLRGLLAVATAIYRRYSDLLKHLGFDQTACSRAAIFGGTQRKLHAPAGAVGITAEQAVTIERNSSMWPDSKTAVLSPGTEVPGSKDRKVLHYTGTLLSRVDPNAGGDSAQPGRRSGDPLTSRERDILTMIGNGLSNKHIARALTISPETVKSHAKNIFLKLAVSTRAEAVFRAWSLGLLRSWEPTLKESAIASSGG